MNNSVPKKCAEYYKDGDYPVDLKSKVHPFLRSSGPDSSIQPPPVNGGLYCGPQNNAPWMPIPAPPTTTYYMQHLVRNADPVPPPGVSEQYPGDNRPGNNYVSMPGINWYDSGYDRNNGPFNIKVIDDKWHTSTGGSADNLVNKNSNTLLNTFDLTQYKQL